MSTSPKSCFTVDRFEIVDEQTGASPTYLSIDQSQAIIYTADKSLVSYLLPRKLIVSAILKASDKDDSRKEIRHRLTEIEIYFIDSASDVIDSASDVIDSGSADN